MNSDRVLAPIFEKPSFLKRMKSMLSVDFYRLFHTPMFYIFLLVAALIPALILTMGSGASETPLYDSTWKIVAWDTPLYAVRDIGQYANMNMVYIFGGIMVSVFIGHDYKSGYVKQLFTTHSRKEDYMISKSLTGAFSMVCMCITYLIGAVAAGLLSEASFEVNVGGLLLAILSKMIMSLGWSSFYTFLNVIFRRFFGISIGASFFFGTGILVIGLASLFGDSPILNLTLYGSSVYACLNSSGITLLVCLACSLGWSVIYNALGSLSLYKTDVY